MLFRTLAIKERDLNIGLAHFQHRKAGIYNQGADWRGQQTEKLLSIDIRGREFLLN